MELSDVLVQLKEAVSGRKFRLEFTRPAKGKPHWKTTVKEDDLGDVIELTEHIDRRLQEIFHKEEQDAGEKQNAG